jgi:hypothetical protein
VQRVFARAELEPERLVDGQTQHADGHVERPRHQRRPDRSERVFVTCQCCHAKHRDAGDGVEQVV